MSRGIEQLESLRPSRPVGQPRISGALELQSAQAGRWDSFVIVHPVIYLDYAATTPLAPAAWQAMQPWLAPGSQFANPASIHGPGKLARKAVESAREQLAAAIGAQADEIIWTSGATESNNLAIKGALEFRGGDNAHLVTSRIEHKCVLDTCRWLETARSRSGARVTYLEPDRLGNIAIDQVLDALRPSTLLVSLMWVNNEIGNRNPVEALAPILKERGVLLHVDAAQALGKLPIDLANTPIDLMSLSGHKFGGPKGVGALFVRKRPRARVAPQMHGGGHEWGMRSGTLATHQIVGMAAALGALSSNHAERLSELRDRMWAGLSAIPNVHRNGDIANPAPHILNVSFEGVEGESLRAALRDVAVSSGSACSSATSEPSYVLRALGRSDELANASLRFSVGTETRQSDIDGAIDRVSRAVEKLRTLAGGLRLERSLA